MERYQAIGAVETFGLVYVLEAADAMVKASDVELVGYENTASGYISVIVQGETEACKTAVEAGVKAVEKWELKFTAMWLFQGPMKIYAKSLIAILYRSFTRRIRKCMGDAVY